MFALVVQKFMDANVSLIPSVTLSPSASFKPVDAWPSQDDKLELLHSPEALEMIQNHLALILGNRVGDSTSVAEISKLIDRFLDQANGTLLHVNVGDQKYKT